MSQASNRQCQDDALKNLTAAQRAWAVESERLWRRAHEIARRYPDSDVSDLYHALRALQLTPTERLAIRIGFVTNIKAGSPSDVALADDEP
jgi:hypothetical protein